MLEQLQRDGIIQTDLRFNADRVIEHLTCCHAHNAHVQAKATLSEPFTYVNVIKHWPMLCHSMHDIVLAPEIFELALGLLPLANAYFGEPALLYSMNAFWTQPAPGHPQYQDTHGWHRDGDDRKQLVAFFMLTAVHELGDGAHQYQCGTHVLTDEQLGRPTNAPDPVIVQTVYGVEGGVFLEDTRGLHMAHRPQVVRRGLAWARFGVSDPPESYIWDKLSPVSRLALGDRYPADPAVQHAIHLVVS